MPSRTKLTHAVVSLPLLDVRAEPRHAAELGSQLLLGETVLLRPGSPKPGWVRVRNEGDGYEGWVRSWGLVPASAARAARWKRSARARITVPSALVRTGCGQGMSVSPVYFGGRLIAGRSVRGWVELELPDGRRGYLDSTALAGRQKPTLEDRIGSLMGVQYLWGGRSPAGYDCSGFVQQVLLEQGIALPRDARHQCQASRRRSAKGGGRRGELAFFRRPGEPASHVGIALGGGYFAHCRGRVVIGSLDAGNPLCDKDLLSQFMGWYRPPRG